MTCDDADRWYAEKMEQLHRRERIMPVKEWDALPLWEKLEHLAWTVDARDALPTESLDVAVQRLEELSEEAFKRCKRTGGMEG